MKHLLLIIICAITVVACNTSDDPAPATVVITPPAMPEKPPASGMIIKTGTFTGFEHNLMGNISLYADSTMKRFLRMEQFTMTPGPDVRVYLSKSNNYSKANVIEIAKLTNGYNNHVFNLEVSSTGYSEQHKFVLVYCLQFNSLFGYAELE